MSGIRQRTGTLLAAQALVASFLGSAIRAHGVEGLLEGAVGVLMSVQTTSWLAALAVE